MLTRSSTPVCAAILLALAGPACATQLYKWVDAQGVTNYSNQPPATGTAKTSAAIENRLSVYTPDPLLARAIEAERARMIEDLKTGRRERQLHEEWLARQYLAAMTAQAVDPCAAGGCMEQAPYPYVAAYAPGRFPLGIVPQIRLTPGATAGAVTGSSGYIPGYSAYAPRTMIAPPRAVREARPAAGRDRVGGVGHRGR